MKLTNNNFTKDYMSLVLKTVEEGNNSKIKLFRDNSNKKPSDDLIENYIKHLSGKLETIELRNNRGGNDRAVIIKFAKNFLLKIKEQGDDVELSEEDYIALITTTLLEQRPSIQVNNGRIPNNNDELGAWSNKLTSISVKESLEEALKSVGRINKNGQNIGTGFVISEDLIVTNKHVLQQFLDLDDSEAKFNSEVTINFSDNGINENTSFELIEPVISTSKGGVVNFVNFNVLDFAILKCDIGSAMSFPKRLDIDIERANFSSIKDIYAIGYPAEPLKGTKLKYERYDILNRLFNLIYDVKRISPGSIVERLGKVSGDDVGTVFSHDCSTLGGSSGSPIIQCNDDNSSKVIGLHFSGGMDVGNYAHAISEINEIRKYKSDFS